MQVNIEPLFSPNLKILSNHEIIVSDEQEMLEVLKFLQNKRLYFRNLFQFEDRIVFRLYHGHTEI